MPLQTWAELRKEAEKAAKPVYEPLPVGNYDVRIIEAEHVIASTSQADGYKVKAEVETGPYTGRKVFGAFYVSKHSPAALGIFFRQMNNLGLSGDFFDSEPGPADIVNALIGKRAVFSLNIETYQGKPGNKVKTVLPPRDGVQAPSPSVPSGSYPSVPGVPGAVPSVPSSVPSIPQAASVPQGVPSVPQAAPAAPQAAPSVPQAVTAQPPASVPVNDPWASTPPPVPPLG